MTHMLVSHGPLTFKIVWPYIYSFIFKILSRNPNLEFKALSKEKKSEFFSKLKAASRKRSERSSCASSVITSKSDVRGTKEDLLAEKIIKAIDSNVRLTIQAELEKIKNHSKGQPEVSTITQKWPPQQGPLLNSNTAAPNKENERPSLTPQPQKPTKSVGPKSALNEIENEINLYKNNERITRQVEEKKREIKKNCAFSVSFGAQVEERNIEEEIRALHKPKNQVSVIELEIYFTCEKVKLTIDMLDSYLKKNKQVLP